MCVNNMCIYIYMHIHTRRVAQAGRVGWLWRAGRPTLQSRRSRQGQHLAICYRCIYTYIHIYTHVYTYTVCIIVVVYIYIYIYTYIHSCYICDISTPNLHTKISGWWLEARWLAKVFGKLDVASLRQVLASIICLWQAAARP